MHKVLLVDYYIDLNNNTLTQKYFTPKRLTSQNYHDAYPPWHKLHEIAVIDMISASGFSERTEPISGHSILALHAKTPIIGLSETRQPLKPAIDIMTDSLRKIIVFSYESQDLKSIQGKIEGANHINKLGLKLHFLEANPAFSKEQEIKSVLESILQSE